MDGGGRIETKNDVPALASWRPEAVDLNPEKDLTIPMYACNDQLEV